MKKTFPHYRIRRLLRLLDRLRQRCLAMGGAAHTTDDWELLLAVGGDAHTADTFYKIDKIEVLPYGDGGGALIIVPAAPVREDKHNKP